MTVLRYYKSCNFQEIIVAGNWDELIKNKYTMLIIQNSIEERLVSHVWYHFIISLMSVVATRRLLWRRKIQVTQDAAADHAGAK